MNRPMHASDVDQHSRVAVPLAPLDAQAMTVRCNIGAPIHTCGEPDRFWYRIVAGAVRQCVFSQLPMTTSRRELLEAPGVLTAAGIVMSGESHW